MTDHAHELRRYARKIAHPAGDVPAVMLAAADEIERLQSVIASQHTMSRDDIIRMAGEAGLFAVPYPHSTNSKEVERFAALVAAATREACAKVCDEMSGSDYLPHQCAAAIRARGDA